MGSELNRFPQQEQRNAWGGCLGAFSCFGSQKGGKRIVPASRLPESNASAVQPNGPQAGLSNQNTTLAPSLLAPPSSPASFTNSALPSTAQSPSCFLSLSAISPGEPSSTMFATGPYAHETQLVSPPVFSTFTTEPSTAPLTPPPELAHLTTPSSPDVPFAQFLTSSMDMRGSYKASYISANDLQATYSLFPGSPAGSLISPISRISGECLSSSFPEREFRAQWGPTVSPQNGKYSRNGSGRLYMHDSTGGSKVSEDTNFFCPATFAQFYLDHNPPFPHTGGRLSVSKDSDIYPSGASGNQNRLTKSPKQDVEELEAYRASFGFSADEIINTSQYVEITDIMDDSLTMSAFTSDEQKAHRPELDPVLTVSRNVLEENKPPIQPGDASGASTPCSLLLTDEDDVFSKMSTCRNSIKYHQGLSCSDAEIDYRRGRNLRDGRQDFARLG